MTATAKRTRYENQCGRLVYRLCHAERVIMWAAVAGSPGSVSTVVSVVWGTAPGPARSTRYTPIPAPDRPVVALPGLFITYPAIINCPWLRQQR